MVGKNIQMRQGDLLIKRIDQLPKEAKLQNSNILVRGESTGHAHRLEGGQVYKDKDLLYLLIGSKGAKIIHNEHLPIKLRKGYYSIIRQRQYQSKDMIKLVQD